ncbi:MAG: M56 family metallopeptidase [Acidobacteria bacterium]|nr:M56 family metallopeptidase [Acidobacteriota bacterium]
MTVTLILQATAIFCVALLGALILRRAPAAQRHMLFVFAMAAALLVPAVTPLVPRAATSGLVELPWTTVMVRAGGEKVVASSWAARLPGLPESLMAIWVAGAAVMLLRVLVGLARAAWLRAAAQPFANGTAGDFRMHATVRMHTAVPMPTTFGFRRPAILLPAAALTWDALKRESVLRHEQAHVERQDCLTTLVVEVARAIYWFHPLAWVIAAKAQQERERACDDAVLLGGVAATDYAGHLVSIAREAQGKLLLAGVPMAAPSQLESRIRAVLNPAVVRRPVSRRLVSMAGVVMLGSVLAVAAAGQATGPLAGTVEVVVNDVTGARVPGAVVSIEAGGGKVFVKQPTSPAGEVSFHSLPAKDYLLEVVSPGFATVTKGLKLTADSGARVEVTLQPDEIFQSATVSGGEVRPAGPPSRIRIGGNVQSAKIINKARIIYPAEAKQKGIQGTVFLRAVISKEGTILSLQVLSAPDKSLADAAVEGVKQWTYQSTLLNGNPVEVVTRIDVNFTLAP